MNQQQQAEHLTDEGVARASVGRIVHVQPFTDSDEIRPAVVTGVFGGNSLYVNCTVSLDPANDGRDKLDASFRPVDSGAFPAHAYATSLPHKTIALEGDSHWTWPERT